MLQFKSVFFSSKLPDILEMVHSVLAPSFHAHCAVLFTLAGSLPGFCRIPSGGPRQSPATTQVGATTPCTEASVHHRN